MAQLKDLIVNGASRLIGDATVNKITITSINAPTSAGGSTYGLGTSGYVLKTNGASVYWATDNNSGGTVTKVTAGTGLSISATPGGNFTTTGTINHTNSVTAQTTQALYPIKIDAQGHISGYGSAVTSLPANDVPAWAKAENKPSYNISEIVPLESKTYTGLIGSSNDATGASFYFAKIRPTSWDVSWRIKYHIRVYVPGYATYDQISDVCITGSQNNLRSYSVFNTINSAYAAYYHNLYRLKSAGYTAGHSHLLGVGLRGSNNNLDSSYARTFVIDLLEVENCTVTFLDACKKYNTTDIPEAGSTNFDGLSELNFTSNGLQETGDNNDPNYQNRIYYTSSKTKEALYRYQMVLRAKDGELIPISSANNTWTADTATTLKTYSSLPFDPFGEIYCYNATGTVNANGNVGNYCLYRQILVDLRYCFDVRDSANRKLTARLPVYLIATPQADGSAVLYVPSGSKWGPLTQTLPSSDDGKIYIYLGQAYEESSPYRIELLLEHPIYIYKNGAVRPYTPSNWSEIANKPTTLAGYGITDANISNGVITLGSSTITPLTSHQSVVNNNINLSRNTETTIATIGGTAIKIKLPASDNTDTKVKQTVKSDNKEYKLLMSAQVSPTSGTAYEAVYDTAITVNPSTDTITATNFAGTATKVGHSITIGDKSFNGQSDVTVNIDDLGLAGSSMEFKGIITQTLADNGTTSPVTPVGGGSLTPVEGNVVIDATGKEYIWTSGKWHNLGLATDFALSEHVHGNISKSGKIGSTSDYAVYTTTGGLVTAGSLATSDPSASSTTSTTFIDTISQNSKGKITATKKTLPTASTSVAGIIKIGTTANDAAAGNHSHTITANATDGYWDLTGTNGTNAVTYALAPYSSRPSNAGFYTGTTAPNGTTRLNYNGYLYATKLYSGGTAVLTSHQTVINNNINLTWDTETTIATIGSTAIKVKLPASPGIEIVRLA